jgi:carbamoyl-phosphate synthase large subunit
VVVKYPRFAFEKFPQTDPTLTIQMKSVGEAMAIGRNFKEALQKAIRSLEIDKYGLETYGNAIGIDRIKEKLLVPNWERIWYIADAIRMAITIDEIYSLTKIDRWFLYQIKEIVKLEELIKGHGLGVNGHDEGQGARVRGQKGGKLAPCPLPLAPVLLREAKEYGFSDKYIARLINSTEDAVREYRKKNNIISTFKTVDTCGAEFEAHTPYLYSTYERPFYRVMGQESWVKRLKEKNQLAPCPLPLAPIVECESNPTNKKKIMILGGGPNRIGQGIEFDYCCVHAALALKEDGFETIMVNCNPETVSTDYDTSDRLYFEPLTREDVLNIIDIERPDGIIVQFGGQTPLKLALPLEAAGAKIIGTSPDSIDRAEDRERFRELINKLNIRQPESGIARSIPKAVEIAERIGYPVLVRPSYVLGGRAMEIVYNKADLQDYMKRAVAASPEHPILIDKYLEDAIEIDVDAISDGDDVVIGGIMEHIEEAGVHSGDSACSLPPFSLSGELIDELRNQTYLLARELDVIGLMNVQYAIKDNAVYVLEVNPRASRTIPFVSKAIGVPLAKLAAKVMTGKKLKELGFTKEVEVGHVSVKEVVFPFAKFPGVDTILGPEMKSTGEVMGIDTSFAKAFAKAQIATGAFVPPKGRAFLSVKDKDKSAIIYIGRKLLELGYSIEATKGTAKALRDAGLTVDEVNKVKEGRPHIVDHIKNGEIDLVINTVGDKQSQEDSYSIRRTALTQNVPYYTTVAGARALVNGMEAIKKEKIEVIALQDYHKKTEKRALNRKVAVEAGK